MFFLYGLRSTKGKPIEAKEVCPSCGKEHTVYVYPYYEYFHIFWIPIFPVSKQIVVACVSCDKVFNVNKKDLNKDIKSQMKTPKWHFIGLVFMLIFFSYIVYWLSSGQKEAVANMSYYIENPQVGDVYEVQSGYEEYTLMKVAAVKNDTIFLRRNKYVVDNYRGIDKLRESYIDSFNLETDLYTKTEMKEKAEANVLRKITRYEEP
jgi:hypothetical protein